ncbi:MAG TPA: hypothetical protein V6D14_15440 [Coleofasciculaceae cyanobacterium]
MRRTPSSLLMTFNQWLETLKNWWQSVKRSPSAEFLAWRDQFLFRRVQLLAWVILIVLLLAGGMAVLVVIPSLTAAGATVNVKRIWQDARDIGIYTIGILVALMLCYRPFFRRYPDRLFLALSWLVLLPSHLHSILRGEAQFDSGTWLLVFSMQALLVPVLEKMPTYRRSCLKK